MYKLTEVIQPINRRLTLVTPRIPEYLNQHYLSVTFYKDNQLIIPTAGQVVLTATENGINYGSVHNGSYKAAVDQFDRPSILGHVVAVKALLTGITGADKVSLSVHSYI